MQCDICGQFISLADFQPCNISDDNDFDFSRVIEHVCPVCNAKAYAALDRQIQNELEIQKLLREYLYYLGEGMVVDYYADPPRPIELYLPSTSASFVVEQSEVNYCCSLPEEDEVQQPVEVSFCYQTDIEILFTKDNFRKPSNLDELNVYILRLAVLLHYLAVDGVFPALPHPFFFAETQHYLIAFRHQQKIKNKVNAKAKQYLEGAARGISLLVQAAIDHLKLNIGDVFNADGILALGGASALQGDEWETWESLWPIFERLTSDIWRRAEDRQTLSKWGE